MSKKEDREQRKAQQRAEAAQQRNGSRNKYITVGALVAIIIGVVVAIQVSRNGDLEAGVSADPRKGAEDALVVVQLYEDFQCPACQAFTPYVQAASEAFADQSVAFEFNDLPLTQIHDNAMIAAEAGQCAFAQDRFWDYHDTLYREQRVWEDLSNVEDQLATYAEDLGLDVDAFTTCLDSGDTTASIREDMKEARQANVQSTPTIFINGERYVNDGTYDSFAAAISEALVDAQAQ